MYYAEAADLTGMQWFEFKGLRAQTVGKASQFNQRHTLKLQPGDVIGLKQTVRGPSAGNYQMVKAEAPHVLFRNVPFDTVKRLQERMKPFKGKPPTSDLAEGRKRAQRVVVTEKAASDKLRDIMYKPAGTINERSMYNKEHYQWRKVVSKTPIKVVTLKQGRSRAAVSENDIIGVRYMTKARGGFIILPDGQRVNISHDSYADIVNNARILPARQQQKGMVLLADIKAVVGKQTRIRKPKEEDSPMRVPKKPISRTTPMSETERAKARLLRQARQQALHERDKEDEGLVPDNSHPNAEVSDSPTPKTHTAFSLEVGSTIRSGRRMNSNTFIVANINDQGSFSELALYNPETTKVSKVRLDKDLDLTRIPDLMIMEKATPSERAAAIRAFNRAQKERKFTPGTIHNG